MYPTIETFFWVDTALRTLFPSQVLPQIVNLDYLRLSQIISYCTPRLSSGPAGFSLLRPRKVCQRCLKTGSGSTIITCHQHQDVSWVSMHPRTKMTPQHMFMILWFSTAWNRYYSIVLSIVSWHYTCPEHTFPNGIDWPDLCWETSVSKLTLL